MDKLVYEGVTYTRNGNFWAEQGGLVVCDIMQDKLNQAFFETIDLSKMRAFDVLKLGDQYKRGRMLGLAIQCYAHALSRATKEEVSYILPRLTSCYRIQGRPQLVIDALADAKRRFGVEVITSVLLTSAAAAYCDMDEYQNARTCCNRAYAKCNGNPSPELKSVYARIRAYEEK